MYQKKKKKKKKKKKTTYVYISSAYVYIYQTLMSILTITHHGGGYSFNDPSYFK